MDGIGELIEKLCIANLKLWAVCDQKAAFVGTGEENAEKLRDLMKKDLDLCKLRAELRKEINLRLGGPQGDNVKCYGGNGHSSFVDPASAHEKRPMDEAMRSRLLSSQLVDAGLATSVCGKLWRNGIYTVGQLVERSASDLKDLRHFGDVSYADTIAWLNMLGLSLSKTSFHHRPTAPPSSQPGPSLAHDAPASG